VLGLALGSVGLVTPAILSGLLPGLLVGVGMVIFGFGLPWALVGANTLIQRRTPLRLQGRVDAAFGVLFGGFLTLSIGVGAIVVGAFGYVPSVLAVVAGGAVSAPYLYTRAQPRASQKSGEDLRRLLPSVGEVSSTPGQIS
jgi:hypothetical protein